MKKIVSTLICCFLIIAAFAQIETERGQPIQSIPDCFCCQEGIYKLPATPPITGDTIICKNSKNTFSILKCPGAAVNWSVNPTAIVFAGQGTSQIQIDYGTVPTGTTFVTICVEIKCGSRSTKNCKKISVCKPQPVTEEFTKGEDAMLHFLPASCATNYGTYNANAITNWTYQGIPAITSSVIKFSLPSIPAASVTYAELILTEYEQPSQTHATLYGTSPGVESTQSALWIKRILNPWSEGTITGCGVGPMINFATTLHEAPVPNYVSGIDNISIPVTTLVQDMLQNGNNGFLLEFQNMTNTLVYRGRSYGSFNNPIPSLRPKLVITHL